MAITEHRTTTRTTTSQHHDDHDRPRPRPRPTTITTTMRHHAHPTTPWHRHGRSDSALQSQRELAEIAFFTAEYGRYEESHPHGHEAGIPERRRPGTITRSRPAGRTGAGRRRWASCPSAVGQWGPVLNWPLVTVHSHLLPTGKVLLWAYSENPRRIWDPATGQIEAAIPAGARLQHLLRRPLVPGGRPAVRRRWAHPERLGPAERQHLRPGRQHLDPRART